MGLFGMDFVFSRLTNPSRGCAFVVNRDPAGLKVYLGIIKRDKRPIQEIELVIITVNGKWLVKRTGLGNNFITNRIV